MRLAVLLLLLLAGPLWGQSVKLPAEVKTQPGVWTIIVPESKDGGEAKWHLSPGLTRVDVGALFPGSKPAGVVVHGPTGRYEVWAWNAKENVASDLAVCVVVVGDAPPVPPGPTPPTPPGPTPPTPPTPVPGGPPLPADGQLRVMVLYESGDLPKYPPSQQAVIYGATVRNYLNAHCPDGGSGVKDWCIWDKDVDSTTAAERWRLTQAWLKSQQNPGFRTPWVTLRKGTQWHSGPLPATVDDMMKLLKTYGGE